MGIDLRGGDLGGHASGGYTERAEQAPPLRRILAGATSMAHAWDAEG